MTRNSPKTPPRPLLILLLTLCTPLAAAQDLAPTFNPFTDHHALPVRLTWIVQAEHPAEQLDSPQARALQDAIANTKLFEQTAKAWSRMARTLANKPSDATALLGRRVQFIAGAKSEGLPWAITLEIETDQKRDLLSRLKAFQRERRHQRSIFELEDGRYLLAVFDQPDSALVLIAPRSDRKIRPEKDPESLLFFEMFDRLAGVTPPPPAESWHPLTRPILAAGPCELLLARLESVPELPDPTSGGGQSEPEPVAPAGYAVLALNRAAGGWDGRIVKSTKDPVEEFSDTPRLRINKIVNALPADSWLLFSSSQGSFLESLLAPASPVSALIPRFGPSPRLLAIINHGPKSQEAMPVLAVVQVLDSQTGPGLFDAAVASLLMSIGDPAPPNHAGLYPEAIRVQHSRAPILPGPPAQIAWGYTPEHLEHRAAVLTIAPKADDANAERTLTAILESSYTLAGPGPSPVYGNFRPHDLVHSFRDVIPEESTPWDLLSRIKSVGWNLTPTRINHRPAMAGSITLRLTQTRQGELGDR